MRVGFGYDAHKLVKNRKLILGGVEIPHEKGLLGHSDADVLVHAIIDALLGAMGLGNIGGLFPDTDPKYKGVSSVKLLLEVLKLLSKEEYIVNNIDSTIVCEEPYLLPHVGKIQKNLSDAIGIDPSRVSIKPKTEEGMGFTGRREGISAYAIALIHKKV